MSTYTIAFAISA